jgi:hypothetical protein
MWPVLGDGHHPVFLTGIDMAARTVEFDLIQFLMGDEATAAYHEDQPDDPAGPPNDYYIVNDNPRLRRLPAAENVEVTVLDRGGRLSTPGDRLCGPTRPTCRRPGAGRRPDLAQPLSGSP